MDTHTPLTAETLLTGFVGAGNVFEFQAEVVSIEVAGRMYKLIRGENKNHMFHETDAVYGVATWETSANGWRLALLAQDSHPFGFNLLGYQLQAPTFVPLSTSDKEADIGLSCRDKDGTITRRVLRPYQLPIRAGDSLEGRMIAEVGVPLFRGDNVSALVPVRFQGCSCGIVQCQQERASLVVSGNDEVQALIMQSSVMPAIRDGVGSNVWHIQVQERDQPVLIKFFYNSKAWRRDEIHR